MKALFDIAFHNEGRATQIRDISSRQDIPARFLEQIFQDLKRAALVTSKRGPRGGYALASAPSEIRLGDVLRALEGPVHLLDSLEHLDHPLLSNQILEESLTELAERIEACFDVITLQDLCDRGELKDIRRQAPRRYVYSI